MLQEYITGLFSYQNKMSFLLGKKTMDNLRHFIDGTIFVYQLTGQTEVVHAMSRSWWNYVERYYGLLPNEGTQGWHRIIRERSKNEEEAFESFFTILRQYILECYPDVME